MENMRFKIGDRVRIKNLDWYNENKNNRGLICFVYANFIPEMSRYCGEILTINQVVKEHEQYIMSECGFAWTDEMIEGLVEEETLIERVDDNGLPFNEWLSHKGAFHVPENYVLKDENCNIINATKIVLEKKNEYPKFKVGDRIKRKGDIHLTTIKDIKDNYYIITIPDFFNNAYITDKLLFSNQNEYELFPNKFDITNLRPFDKVLVRGDVGQKWTLDFFGFMDKDKGYPFVCVGHYIIQCIPYEGNECLLGTTNDCDDFYKTWK